MEKEIKNNCSNAGKRITASFVECKRQSFCQFELRYGFTKYCSLSEGKMELPQDNTKKK